MLNGLKKEIMFFTRGGRFIGLIAVTLAMALSSPLLFGAVRSMSELVQSADAGEQYNDAFAMFDSINSAYIASSCVEYIAGTGAIVMMFLFMGAAGGEQKKRSVMIPRCSGLTPTGYALPKFLLYPPVVFIVAFLSVFAGAWTGMAIFGGGLDMGLLSLSALCTGAYMAFLTVLQFTVGLCTGKPGLAVAVSIIMQMLLPSVLSFFRVDKFNPFALYTIAEAAAYKSGGTEINDGSIVALAGQTLSASDIGTLNVTVSLATAVIIAALLIFLTVFTLSARQITNEGNEPEL